MWRTWRGRRGSVGISIGYAIGAMVLPWQYPSMVRPGATPPSRQKPRCRLPILSMHGSPEAGRESHSPPFMAIGATHRLQHVSGFLKVTYDPTGLMVEVGSKVVDPPLRGDRNHVQ